jgi:alkylation response protein AidB-like acyl-CoA dehydrogenase
MIDMQPTSDQQEVIDAVARFLTQNLPVSRYRRMDTALPLAPSVVKEIVELGWIGLGVPEKAGGAGFTLIDDLLVCRELGRQLAPLSLFAAVAGARVAAKAGRDDLASGIISGQKRVAVAVRCAALGDTSGLLLADAVDSASIVGLTDESAYLVMARDLGPSEPVKSLDVSATLEKRSLPTGVKVVDGGPGAAVETMLLGSALLVGMAEAARDQAVAYAKEREQFGQAIGAFQAIKHICADAALRAEAAKCLLFFAAIEAEADGHDAPMHAIAAKIMAADACMLNAGSNIQIHGGAGFTDELDAHLYVKRAHIIEHILGSQRWHQSVLGKSQQFKVKV